MAGEAGDWTGLSGGHLPGTIGGESSGAAGYAEERSGVCSAGPDVSAGSVAVHDGGCSAGRCDYRGCGAGQAAGQHPEDSGDGPGGRLAAGGERQPGDSEVER